MRGKQWGAAAVALILVTGGFAATASKGKNKPTISFATLYNFTDSRTDGGYIFGQPVVDASGNIYGTAEVGGASNDGAVWELTSSGTEWVLHSFDYSDGCCMFAANVHRDKAGDFFGVAQFGGTGECGTLFEYSAGGAFSVLHNFNCGSDGSHPTGSILEYKGNLYGTAQDDGASGYGSVWQYNISSATFTVLHGFAYSDGDDPTGGVACQQGKKMVCAGNLFGTPVAGGTNGEGTVWEINSSGTFTSLHSFGGSDGANPYSRPFVDKAGDVYGTTGYGGSSSYGTVWKITGAKTPRR
jgi:uncharacterized repeat protein (TIGR03803 family)